MFSDWIKKSRYSRLAASCEEIIEDGDSSKAEQTSLSRPRRSSRVLPIVFATALFSSLAGFAVGIAVAKNRSIPYQAQGTVPQGYTPLTYALHITDKSKVPISQTTQVFKFNQSFADPPTIGETEPIWDSLIPSTFATNTRRASRGS